MTEEEASAKENTLSLSEQPDNSLAAEPQGLLKLLDLRLHVTDDSCKKWTSRCWIRVKKRMSKTT